MSLPRRDLKMKLGAYRAPFGKSFARHGRG